jgi:hypothetical protein
MTLCHFQNLSTTSVSPIPSRRAYPLEWWVLPVDVLPHALACPVGQAGVVDSLCHHARADAIALGCEGGETIYTHTQHKHQLA